jgi:hypothetical protein
LQPIALTLLEASQADLQKHWSTDKMSAITATSQAISTNARRVVAAAGIGLAILVPTFAAIELATAPTSALVAGAGNNGSGGNNRDHARLGTGQYTMNTSGPQMRYTPPASGQYIGGIN